MLEFAGRDLAANLQFMRHLTPMRSVNPAGGVGAWRWWGWDHQAQALQKKDGALRGASPDKLATFALAILHVNVSARILQAAIRELAIHVDAVVQDDMLIFEGLVFKSIHRFTRAACGYDDFCLSRRRQRRRGNRPGLHAAGTSF